MVNAHMAELQVEKMKTARDALLSAYADDNRGSNPHPKVSNREGDRAMRDGQAPSGWCRTSPASRKR